MRFSGLSGIHTLTSSSMNLHLKRYTHALVIKILTVPHPIGSGEISLGKRKVTLAIIESAIFFSRARDTAIQKKALFAEPAASFGIDQVYLDRSVVIYRARGPKIP